MTKLDQFTEFNAVLLNSPKFFPPMFQKHHFAKVFTAKVSYYTVYNNVVRYVCMYTLLQYTAGSYIATYVLNLLSMVE